MELKAGVREGDEERSAFRGVMLENSRRRDETLSQYVNRRTRDFVKASQLGLDAQGGCGLERPRASEPAGSSSGT